MKSTGHIPVGDQAGDYSPSGSPGLCAEPAGELTVPAEHAGLRVDQSVARLLPQHSRNRLQGWLREGRILVDGELAEPKDKVWGGELLEVAAPEEAAPDADRAEAMPLAVVFEDAHILVIDKPVGLVVHPGAGVPAGTLLNALLHHHPGAASVPRAGIVHRLDRDTSGLMVVAKTLEAQTDLVRQLQARSVKRQYVALVHGQLARAGSVDAAIGRHPTQRTKMAVAPGGRTAITHYTPLDALPGCTLVQCDLETGRTHQIRVHMAHLGHPLVGDATYGKRKSASALLDAFPRQALHARRLGLVHPASGEPMEWHAPLPEDMQTLLDQLHAEAAA